jgi:hypothetical protein
MANSTRKLSLVAAVVAVAALLPAWSSTIMPPEPDSWFVAYLEIDRRSLPRGIQWSPAKQSFRNPTGVAFYFVRPFDSPMAWKTLLPKDVLPNYKLVNDRTYQFDYNGWHEDRLGRSGRGLPLTFMLSDADRKKLSSALDAARGKPTVVIPAPITVTVAGFRGSSPVALPIRIAFAIDYSPPWIRIESATPEHGPHTRGLEIVSRRGPGTASDLAIANPTDVPFFVVRRFGEPIQWRDETPDDVLPMAKLVTGKVYWASFFPGASVDGKKAVGGWQEYADDWLRQDASWVEEVAKGVKVVEVRKDCRPKQVKLPAPQRFAALVLHGSRRILIKGRIKYRLNPNYDPLAGQGPPLCGSCTGPMCKECAAINREAKKARERLKDYCKNRAD